MVTLHPASPDGKPAFGRTDASGRAVLSTLGTNDGAIPGDYTVTVVKREGGQESQTIAPSEVGAMPANSPSGPPAPPPQARHLLPPKYADAQTSDLKVTVSASEENNLTVELRD